jgi:type I restriction enzyme S subunit
MPLIATNCISNNGLYPTYDTVRYVDDATYRSWFRGHPKPGDLILVLKGSPGRVALTPNPVDFCIAQDMVAITVDETRVYPRYLLALLRSPTVQRRIQQMHVGTLIPHFKKGDFGRLHLPLPDREVQLRIGDAYFSLSERIELNRRMNRTLESVSRALFQSWFVDFDPVLARMAGGDLRLPPELAAMFPASMREARLGLMPEDWESGCLGDLTALNPEAWSRESRPEVLCYVDLSNTKWGRIEAVAVHSGADAPSRAQRILRRGDTIVGTVRPGNGSFAFVSDDGLTGSTGFAVLRPAEKEYQEFVYLAATAPANIAALATLADGGAYPAVRPETVAATPVVVPPRGVVAAFSRSVEPLFKRIGLNNRETDRLVTLRDALLPRIISGEFGTYAADGSS